MCMCVWRRAGREGAPRQGSSQALLLLLLITLRDPQPAHLEDAARDGLHVGRQLEARELVDEAVQGLAHLGEADELADVLGGEVVPALPRQILLLDLFDGWRWWFWWGGGGV